MGDTLRVDFSQDFASVPMTIHWIILLNGRTELYSFHEWMREPTTLLVSGSFERASLPLLRIQAESSQGCEE
jgi:hypothetical protein